MGSWQKKRLVSLVGVLVISGLGVSACGQSVPETPSPVATVPVVPRMQVVAVNSVVCDLTRQVGGDRINLVCLIPAGQDPHEYSPTAEDAKLLETAQLVLYGGYNFEEGLTKLVKNNKAKGTRVAIAEVAVPKPIIAEAGHHHGDDHDHGKEDKAAPDPHVWHSAQNGIKMVETIGKQLSKADPAHQEIYIQNAKTTIEELRQLDTWIKTQIATIPTNQRKLVTTHSALGYYAQAYAIPVQSALLGISTTEQANPQRVAELVRAIRSAGVPTIFAEATANSKLIQAVAKEAQVQVAPQSLFTDGLAPQGEEADTYQKMLIHNTKVIVEGLGGKFTPFLKKSP